MKANNLLINKDFDASILRTIIKRNWLWFLFFIVLFATGAFFYLRYTKPVYESSMLIQLGNEDNAKEILNVENINSRNSDMSSEIELMRSQLMIERALSKLNVSISYFSKGKILTEEKYQSSSFMVTPFELKDSSLVNVPIFVTYENEKVNLTYTIGAKKHKITGKLNQRLNNQHFDISVKINNLNHFYTDLGNNELYFVFNSIQGLALRLSSNLSVIPIDPVAKTIQVSVRGNNPRLCYDLTNAVAAAFNSFEKENKRSGSENILRFIDQQLDSLSNELSSSKDSLMLFQRRSNISDLESTSSSISTKIDALQNDMALLEEEMRSLNLVNEKLKVEPNRLEVYKLLPEMLGKSYEQSLANQIESLHDLLEKKEDILFRVTPDNTEVKAINTKMNGKLAAIRKSIAVVLDRLRANKAAIQSKITAFENEFMAFPEKKMEFNRLKNIQDLNDKYFALLTEKKVLYSISDAGYTLNNRILTRPSLNMVPVSPNPKVIYSSFLLFGVFIGFLLLLIGYLRFNEIHEIEDLKNILPDEASVLGEIPHVKNEVFFSQLLVSNSPKSMLSEMLRKIRANLNFIHPNYKTIAISSSVSGEGKTFVALNLAGIIAMSGKKTILLDLDLRKPKVHFGFNHDNTFGMSSLIVNNKTLEECIKHSEIENLDFITAGPIPPNPSELLLSTNYKLILEQLKEKYDVIITDNPPIGLVSDGIKNLSESDIPIYVFKSNFSKRNYVFRLRELIELKQVTKLNVILNSVDNNRRSNYGYGYYEENEKVFTSKKPLGRRIIDFFRK